MQNLLVETNTTRTQHLYEKLTVTAAARARLLPVTHPTRRLAEEQDSKVAAKCRTPLPLRAIEISERRVIELDAVPNRKALQREFILYHRNEWRNSGKGKLLVFLTPASHDDTKRLQLPLYAERDCSRGASVRAKLRFDRSNLKDTLARQTIIPESKAFCHRCLRGQHRGIREDVRHVLLKCPAFQLQRQKLRATAKLHGLPVKCSKLFRWLLGDFSVVKRRASKSIACDLSRAFLLSVDDFRPF